MYNLRYHIASLIAVFLALAVGLLLGTVVAERGMITDQAGALVADLEARFDDIQATNAELQTGLERDHEFAEAAAIPLTAGLLPGANVAVIVGTGRVDGVNAVAEAVAGAGGTTFTAALEVPALGLDAEEPAGLAGYFELQGVEMAAPGEQLERQVADALAAEWRTGESFPLTELLVAEGLLGIESTTGTATVDAIVVMGGGEPGCDPFALALAQSMEAAGGVSVGAETSDVEGGVPSVCAGEGLSALDHAGTPQGRVSLVYLLARRAKGFYGSSEQAEAYFPPL